MNRDEIIDFLKSHKMKIAMYDTVLNEIQNDVVSIQAQRISDMPKSSNDFRSIVEDEALNNTKKAFTKELRLLVRDINQVRIWLEYLTVEQRFVVEQFYFEERRYSMICNAWNTFYSNGYWKKKRREAIRKIHDIQTKLQGANHP